MSQKTYCTGILRTNRKNTPQEEKNAVLKKGETVAHERRKYHGWEMER